MKRKILKRFEVVMARRVIEYDEKHNVTKGEALEDRPLSFYIRKGVGKKLLPVSDVTSHQTEDQVVAACSRWLKANGWVCKTLFTGGIPIGGGRYATNPCKGIPDCIAFNTQLKKIIWIEYKKSKGGIISYEQEVWHSMLRTCGEEVYVVTSLQSLKDQLVTKVSNTTFKEVG